MILSGRPISRKVDGHKFGAGPSICSGAPAVFLILRTIDYTSSLNDVVVEFSLLIKTIVTVEPVGILPSPPAFCFMTCGTITFCSLHSPQRRRPYCCSRVCTYTGAFPLAPTPVGSLGSFMQVHKGSKIAVIAPLCLAAVEK